MTSPLNSTSQNTGERERETDRHTDTWLTPITNAIRILLVGQIGFTSELKNRTKSCYYMPLTILKI